MIYDVFISYSSEEQHLAKRLTTYLEYCHVNCFIACRDIPDGVAWGQGIAEAIKHSKMMIVLFSDSFNSSMWLDEELKIAFGLGTPILTLSFSNVAYSDEKSRYLKNTPCIDMICDTEMKFTLVYEEVCQLLGIPIEPVPSASQVLSDFESVSCNTKQSAEIETDVSEKKEMNVFLNNCFSHQLMKSVVIGLFLSVIVVLLLELILNL